MFHSFDVDIARQYGILEAVILHHMEYWISKNVANNQNCFDGCYWTYNSMKAYGELFPYASERQIRYALDHLRKEGLIKTGNYNPNSYDRTLWYAFTEKGYSILHQSEIHLTNLSNGNDSSVEPIPSNIPDILPSNNTGSVTRKRSDIPPSLDDVKSYCRERGNVIDAEYFYDFYNARDWVVGRTKMKDWKAAVRYWERDEKKRQPRNATVPKTYSERKDFLGK